jgi:integrase
VRRTRLKKTEVTIGGKLFYLVTWPKPIGTGRQRQYFSNVRKADAFLNEKQRERDEFGRQGMLTSGDRLLFTECCEALKPFGKTLRDAVEHFVEHLRTKSCNLSVQKFAEQYVQSKEAKLARGDLKKCHVVDIQNRLNKFTAKFGDVQLGQVDFKAVEPWLDERGSTQNRRNFYTVVSGLFNEAVRFGHITANPLSRIEKPKKSNGAPEIYTVDEMQKLLSTAKQIAPDVLPIIALGAFAGVRSDLTNGEISRLSWEAIDFRGHIDISASVAKRAKRRVIPMQPNLAAWLEPYRGKTGLIIPADARKKLDAVFKTAGVARKNNALRHSFASYRFEATRNEATVAYELGHPSSALLYNTYRELVKPADAERYWQITPKKTSNVVAFGVVAPPPELSYLAT